MHLSSKQDEVWHGHNLEEKLLKGETSAKITYRIDHSYKI